MHQKEKGGGRGERSAVINYLVSDLFVSFFFVTSGAPRSECVVITKVGGICMYTHVLDAH